MKVELLVQAELLSVASKGSLKCWFGVHPDPGCEMQVLPGFTRRELGALKKLGQGSNSGARCCEHLKRHLEWSIFRAEGVRVIF